MAEPVAAATRPCAPLRSRAGVLLAGGAGRRIGGPKALLELGGATLAARGVDLLMARCEQVIVVSRPEVPLGLDGVRVVHDRPGPDAPLTGIATGLAGVTCDEVVVLACDLPFAGPAIDLLLAAGPPPVVAAAGGHVQPLCAVYPRRAALDAAERLLREGTFRATALAEALGSRAVEVPASALMNINSASDLREARRRVGD